MRMALALVVGAFLLVAFATVYFTHQEIQAVENQHELILTSEAQEAANSISAFVKRRQQLVEVFALEKQAQLSALADDPGNLELRGEISQSLSRWFPSYFTFTISDPLGTDLIDDLDGFVGQACQTNIQQFVGNLFDQGTDNATYETVIHPQANHYHYDVMAPWRDRESLRGVFFVSFRPDTLAEILASHQSPGHHLVLINRDRAPLIEVSAKGSRDIISFTRDVYLSAEEMAEIRTTQDVESSLWQLSGYLQPGLLNTAKVESWSKAAIILAILLAAGTFSYWKMLQLSRQREQAFDELQVSNASLQDMADEQKTLREEAESGERTKAQFLASMSHEIRTPLNAVIGLTDLVLKTDLTDSQHRYLKNVSLAGRNLLALINDILDFSKIEAGKLEIENIEFDLDSVLENVSAVVSTKAEENGNEIVFIVDNDVPTRLIGDSLRLGQIINNLAGNAAKFTENGEILIHVVMTQDNGRDFLTVSVRDTGIGMTDEQSSRLFQPFVQADQSVTRTHGGTGLGLSISKQLVEAMGGTISVTSRLGDGSTFHFSIPVSLAKGTHQRTTVTGIDPSSTRILVVDDNELICDTLADALRHLRFDVDIAGSGQEAMQKFAAAQSINPYDALLIDWQMPGMDGVETIRTLKSETATHPLPVVMMVSSNDMERIKPELMHLGVRHTLQKPVNTSFLIDTLMALFQTSPSSQKVQPLPPAPKIVNDDLRGHRVLLAEDNELNQMVALGILEDTGCVVDIAENGKVAVEKLREAGKDYYALVLMDIQMPELDGVAATRKIITELGFTDLPIIAMTAHALDEEKKRFTDAGMCDHISKPVDARELVGKIKKWSAASGPAAGSASAADCPPEPETEVFSLEALKKRLPLPDEKIAKLLNKFVSDFSSAADNIDRLLAENDLEKAKLAAHSLKGVAATMGATQVSQLASDIEHALKNEKDIADIQPMVPHLKQVLDQTFSIIREQIK